MKLILRVSLSLAAASLASTCLAENPLSLPKVTMAPDGSFSLSLVDSQETQILSGRLFCNATNSAEPKVSNWSAVEPARRAAFQSNEGHRVAFAHSPVGPFTLVEAEYRRSDRSPKIPRSVDVATLPFDLGVSAERLRILGTGGLASAGQSQGSYMWLAIADPATRSGVVLGWLTTERASGVFIPRVEEGRVIVTARLDFGRVDWSERHSEVFETLAIGWFSDVRDGLEAYADALARIHQVKLPRQPCGYCTWYHAGSSSEKRIADLSEFASTNLKPFGFEVVQIDDGWQAGQSQNGPRKNFTTHRQSGPFARGMKSTAETIGQHKLTPGLWFMPFAGTWDDPYFKDKQDWFVKREDGKPYDTSWGGTSLDLTRPDVQEFIRANVHRLTSEWGYKYLKMDGLYTGAAVEQQYVNDAYKEDGIGNAVLSDPSKTNVEALRTGLRIIRDSAGPDVFLLGCCAPQNMRSYGGAFGLVDAMRIGPDNGATTDGLLVGPRYGSRNYFLHGRVWWNDPDPIYVRTSLSKAQAELSCSWAAVSGQMTVASDELPRLHPDRLDLLKRVMPAHGQRARPIDLLERELPSVWKVEETKRMKGHHIISVYNWDNKDMLMEASLDRLGLDPHRKYAAYEFWSNSFNPAFNQLTINLAPIGDASTAGEEKKTETVRHCCAVFALRALGDHPQVLSTSRHVTQGMIDVEQESWDNNSHSLCGTSNVVGGDPYELRIIKDVQWKFVEVLLPNGESKGVKVTSVREETGLLRIGIVARESTAVIWRIRFDPISR